MALAGVSLADTSQSVTLGSYVTYDGTKYDMIDEFVGLTANSVKSTYGITGADQLTYDTTQTFTLSTNDLLLTTTGESVLAGADLQITKISFLGRADSDDYQAEDSVASITIGEVVYTSSVAVYTDSATGYNLVTYSFAPGNSPTFTLGSDVTFTLTPAGNASAQKMPVSVFQGTNISGAPNPTGTWLAPFQLTATVTQQVPEPTTATLSLLALAGLAARRRRK